jgi:FlaA1/EpsC-like NDP-sugar epimerase
MSQVSLLRLLGRPRLAVPRLARGAFEGRTVLVTGAGGSIGSALCGALVRRSVGQLILLELAETSLIRVHRRVAGRAIAVLGSAGDARLVEHLFERYRPDLVFHAAAFKHLPLLESQVVAAVDNNVLATHVMTEAAMRSGARRFILLSTDKAVNPTSVLGVTKRVAELMLLAREPTATRLTSVRLGNVLGTSGSVLPRLRKELRRHAALSLRHPDATRLFATSAEAVAFLLGAALVGTGGDILVPDLGTPVSIVALARRLAAGSLVEPRIVFTGLLPGEKLHEESHRADEVLRPTASPRLARAEGPAVPRDAAAWAEELAHGVRRQDAMALLAALRRIVPEYRPSPLALEAAQPAAAVR